MKTCNRCQVPKELTDFSKDSSTVDGRRNRCRTCMSEVWKTGYQKDPDKDRERVKKWQLANPEKRKLIQKNCDLKTLYGLSLEDYRKRLAAQDGKCEICKSPFGVGKLGPQVDHCHTSGKIRGLLCTGCNTGLGSFKDNTFSLATAIIYLNLHSVPS